MKEKSECTKRVPLSRNELLKSLGAFGSAVLSTNMPTEKWVQPKIVSGVIPAHAQSSLPRFSITCWIVVVRENGEIIKDKVLPNSSLWVRPFYQISPAWADIPLNVNLQHIENGTVLSQHSAHLITPEDGIAWSSDYYLETGASGSIHQGGAINLLNQPAVCSRTYNYP